MSNNETLTRLSADLLTSRIKIVDLTQTLSSEFPALQLPPEFLVRYGRLNRKPFAVTTRKVRAGTGTTFPVASTVALTLTRRCTGSPARIIQTTRSIP
jgi:hypothetical protein